MGTKLATRASLASTPLVQTKTEVGQVFIGRLVDKREVNTAYYEVAYEFEVIESTMPFVVKVGTEYKAADVEVGARASIFASTRLDYALQQVEQGQVVKITYLGLGKKSKRGGRAPHDYDVEILG